MTINVNLKNYFYLFNILFSEIKNVKSSKPGERGKRDTLK